MERSAQKRENETKTHDIKSNICADAWTKVLKEKRPLSCSIDVVASYIHLQFVMGVVDNDPNNGDGFYRDRKYALLVLSK
mmetsp:Transcript_39597/g.83237  ORF Transcript_39597/g.83237 Transcript_39597/m.83237 type:complete len:80 (-) Transcript_39597:165-404(-)